MKSANEYRVSSEQRLKERLNFEALLADISARFVNLPADRIDSEVEDAQRRICEHLDLDRATLWQVNVKEPGTLLLTHLHQIPGGKPPARRMIARDFFPWTSRKVLGGETVTISKLTDLPPEADRDAENFRLYDTKSNVLLPLSVGEGPVLGLLSFSNMHAERDWPETIVKRFTLIAQVFANALARKQADTERKEMEESTPGAPSGDRSAQTTA